jgi:two-component system CheB/CheR fusion protein
MSTRKKIPPKAAKNATDSQLAPETRRVPKSRAENATDSPPAPEAGPVPKSAAKNATDSQPAPETRRVPKSRAENATDSPPAPEPGRVPKSPAMAGNGFPIVGIGASAGGLEALEQFFANVPDESGLAFVVIQHLDPTHIGVMPELLQRITGMKVFQATDRLKVRPDCVYVIPPNKSMSLLNGALHLFDPLQSRGLRLPIDIFFRSLAVDSTERSVGIILSGMGSDGSLGLKAIKESHGLVLVQEPSTAKFDSMPRSAIEAVTADIVAPAEELAGRLISYLKFTPTITVDADLEDRYKGSFEKIIILLRDQTGHDFSLYKKNTLFRRIERRKGIYKIDRIQNYVRFLQENPSEIEILFNELLIGVTSFFRDPKVWDFLEKKILPELLKGYPEGNVFRAWVPGCSTGEEAYSLAMVFKSAIEKIKNRRRLALQIFATDLDRQAIDRARKGYFPKNIETDVSAERIHRFFREEGEGYRLNTEIREMVVFAPQNVIKDPPFTKLDILSCRNVLIYMEPELQKKLLALFAYSLNPNGILLLGTAETPGARNDSFIALDSKLKLYNRNPAILSPVFTQFPSSLFHRKAVKTDRTTVQKEVENLQTLTDQMLLQRFTPASVLVNGKGDILYITGRTGKYLEPVAGKANWNIHAMARDGLRQILPGAFHTAMLSYEAVAVHNIKLETNGESRLVDVTVQRIESPSALRDMVIVVFNDVAVQASPEIAPGKPGKRTVNARQRELEMELLRTNEELQNVRGEMQTSQEELKSTNEELQSMNEELQSTNEELTTSKEEMQSLNEELQTVNAELQSKVNDFIRANDDMKNLLNSTEIATLFLDKDLNIRRYTDQVTNIFKLRMADIGRPFTDLVSDLQYPEIDKHARQVIKTLVASETEIATHVGNWYNIRIMPYRTVDDRIDGLVITFSDISSFKKLELELKVKNDGFRKRNLHP